MNPTSTDALRIVAAAAEELNEQLEEPIDLARGADAPLYGKDGVLDSLELVNLILLVEERAAEAFGRPFTLVDDRALSAHRSPFRTVGHLAEHVAELAA